MNETPLKPREIAAVMIAEGRYDLAEIAEKVGVTRKSIFNWRRDPKFAARVADMEAQFASGGSHGTCVDYCGFRKRDRIKDSCGRRIQNPSGQSQG